MLRSTTLLFAFAAAALIIGSGCRETSWRRSIEARPTATIFSALDLPTPDRVRTASGAPGPDYWQQRADYAIDASLDVETNRVAGRATITYTNNSPDPLDYLWIHLEQNIFRADSLGTQISSQSSIAMNDSFTGGCVVESMRTGETDLPWTVYDTVARVDLPEAIAPDGGRFEFDVVWHFDMPEKVFRRFGIEPAEQGAIYEVAQWFPAVAVYDDVHGWNTLPYLGTGEFYTNFGTYDVRLTVPRSHVLAATGAHQNPGEVYTEKQQERLAAARESSETVVIRSAEEIGAGEDRPEGEGPLTWHFLAENVRTFAWASSASFIFDACDLDGILVQSVYPKEKEELWSMSTQMLRTAIKGYNERWFRYPYPEATNVYGAEGGMEYPMIIFCRGRSERGLYGVTTHEIGHNWFPMIVNTDERRHAWMDEGFNTFINYYSTGDWFEGEVGRRGSADRYAGSMRDRDQPPVEAVPDHLPRGMLGRLAYAKPAVGLVLLREQILGEERFDHAFRTYIRRWAFKSPRPADFFRTMEDASGADLAWFWRGWFLEPASLDQMVRGVAQGFDERKRTRIVTVTIDNLRDLVMPVVLDVTYADGTVERRELPVQVWFSRDRYKAKWATDKRVVRVEIDADRKYPDVDRLNNVWRW